MRHPLQATGHHGRYVVGALVAIAVLAVAIGAVSQRSEIDNLNSKNATLATGKEAAIQQRDAAQQALEERAVQNSAHEADEQKIEALRPPGATLFAAQCASCHGREGDGGVGPQLSDGTVAKRLTEEQALAFVTSGGVPPMPTFGTVLSPAQIQQVVTYIRKL
jgi:mono/diheme cytochrome c family protein